MHKIQPKWTKKKASIRLQKQISTKKNIRLKALIPADNEEVNFLYGNYLKILKAKDQLQTSHQVMIHHLAIVNNCSMRGSSFKQIKLSKLESLESTENYTKGFVLLASVKSSSSNCLRAKSQLLWSHCRQLSFSATSQRVKRKICVQKENKTTKLKMKKEKKTLTIITWATEKWSK